jgi:hypothetical protein
MSTKRSETENRAPEAKDEATDRLITGAEQQVGAGEQVEEAEQPSAAEAEDRGGAEQRSEDDEEAPELDEALDESFPASDPPSVTTKGRIK